LRRAIAESDREELLMIAKAVLAKAAEGDIQAVKEIGDRLDGRPVQPVGGDEELGPIRHEFAWKSDSP